MPAVSVRVARRINALLDSNSRDVALSGAPCDLRDKCRSYFVLLASSADANEVARVHVSLSQGQ